MTPSQRKRLEQLVKRYLQPHRPLQETPCLDSPAHAWDAAFDLIDQLLKENKTLEKEYRALAVAASESFYSIATQLSRRTFDASEHQENF